MMRETAAPAASRYERRGLRPPTSSRSKRTSAEQALGAYLKRVK